MLHLGPQQVPYEANGLTFSKNHIFIIMVKTISLMVNFVMVIGILCYYDCGHGRHSDGL